MTNTNAAATPAQNLIRFNIRNAKYAFPTPDGGWGDFVSMGTSTKMALETDSSEKEVYGDGECIIHYVNEKGKTGTLTQNNICNAYEIACGRKILLENGLADGIRPKIVKEAYQVFECTWDSELENAYKNKAGRLEGYDPPYRNFNGITSKFGAH